jgi:hypothetical protein
LKERPFSAAVRVTLQQQTELGPPRIIRTHELLRLSSEVDSGALCHRCSELNSNWILYEWRWRS